MKKITTLILFLGLNFNCIYSTNKITESDSITKRNSLLSRIINSNDLVNDTFLIRSKKGKIILPEKNDFALGFNAIPMIQLLPSLITDPKNRTVEPIQFTNNINNQVCGKYFLNNRTALRVRLGINTLGGSIINKVQDAQAMYKATFGTNDDIEAASLIKVEDKLKFHKNNVFVSLGLEKRKGQNRLQGYYGVDLNIGQYNSTERITYGNAFSDQYPIEFTNNFYTLETKIANNINFSRVTRNLASKSRSGLKIGVRSFIGIEYFVSPKISLSAEYGFGYLFSIRNSSNIEREVYNNGQNGIDVFIENVNVDSKEFTNGFVVDNNSNQNFTLLNSNNSPALSNTNNGALTVIFHF